MLPPAQSVRTSPAVPGKPASGAGRPAGGAEVKRPRHTRRDRQRGRMVVWRFFRVSGRAGVAGRLWFDKIEFLVGFTHPKHARGLIDQFLDGPVDRL